MGGSAATGVEMKGRHFATVYDGDQQFPHGGDEGDLGSFPRARRRS